jgi:[ribosomal protein S18]-alanine N-acetyltransferase
LLIAVAEPVRGQGIGRRLLSALQDEAARARLAGLALTVSPRNPHAIALYETSGFLERGRTDSGLVIMSWPAPRLGTSAAT